MTTLSSGEREEGKPVTFDQWLSNKKSEVGWYSPFPKLEEFLRIAWDARDPEVERLKVVLNQARSELNLFRWSCYTEKELSETDAYKRLVKILDNIQLALSEEGKAGKGTRE